MVVKNVVNSLAELHNLCKLQTKMFSFNYHAECYHWLESCVDIGTVNLMGKPDFWQYHLFNLRPAELDCCTGGLDPLNWNLESCGS